MSRVPDPGPALHVDYFDGLSARPQPAQISCIGTAGSRRLRIRIEGQAPMDVAWADVQWPERQRHGRRVAHLAQGGELQGQDTTAWDAFTRSMGVHDSWVVRAQQNWRSTFSALAVLVGLVGVAYVWGLPRISQGLVAITPLTVDRQVGELALASVSERWLQPSALPAERQTRLREQFNRMVALSFAPATANGAAPIYELRFHKSSIGPNAFALPGGVIVLTDELVTLVDGHDDVVLGVLAHELGHVQHRHGMRTLAQFTVLGTVTSVALGDFSSVLAGASALIGQMAYSRDFEREADVESARMLRAAGHSPEAMVVFFEKVAKWRKEQPGGSVEFNPGIALSSHPADEARIAFFREAARGR